MKSRSPGLALALSSGESEIFTSIAELAVCATGCISDFDWAEAICGSGGSWGARPSWERASSMALLIDSSSLLFV